MNDHVVQLEKELIELKALCHVKHNMIGQLETKLSNLQKIQDQITTSQTIKNVGIRLTKSFIPNISSGGSGLVGVINDSMYMGLTGAGTNQTAFGSLNTTQHAYTLCVRALQSTTNIIVHNY